MTSDPYDAHFVAVATTAVDAARVLTLPDLTPDEARSALDQAHALLVAAHQLLDAHARTRSAACAFTPDTQPHLAAARDHLWHAAEQVHLAFHHAPLPGDWCPAARPPGSRPKPDRGACHRGLPEGAPALTICRRHHEAAARVRRATTPADLTRRRINGAVRHARTGQEGTAAA